MEENRPNGGQRNWASVAGGSPEAMEAVQNALPVQLIATPRRNLETCRAGDDLAQVAERNAKRESPFDHLPVVEGGEDERGTIIGLLDLTPFRSGRNPQGENPQGFVKCRMRPLSEDILIGADASILDFVRTADRHPCRLVVSGAAISGLVTLSDLQQLPVRSALFATITHLEMTMAGAIRREFDGSNEWMQRLSENRQSKLREKVNQSSDEDGFIESLLFTDFCEKRTIIHKSQLFEWSKTAFKTEMEKVEKLRNFLAHANDYASTPAAASRVCETIRPIDRWACRLNRWLREAPDDTESNGVRCKSEAKSF